MNRFQKDYSLAAVFVVFNQRMFYAVQGQGEQLGILYLGSRDAGAPANANAVLASLRDEVLAEPDNGEFSVAGSNPPGEPPWTLTIHNEESGDDHLWIARDFKSPDPAIPAAGIENCAMLIFATPETPNPDIAAIDNLADLEEKSIKPTRATLYAASDTPGLSSAARDYGAARDLDA